ncbi:MAG: transglutaminase-like domain-containing protein [Actinomycetes bacterium]
MKPGQNISIKQNASNEQLQSCLEKALPGAVAQTKNIAPQFKGATDSDTCRKIFDFLLKKVKYDKDGFTQKIKYPSALLRERRGDCKSYSLFTAAILKNLNIPFRWTYASYTPGVKTPGHVYITTDSGCIIDCVWGKFNSEKQPYNKFYKSMNISYISGIDDGCAPSLGNKNCGPMGAVNGKTILLAPGRQLFRLIVQGNLDGFATKLAKLDQAKVAKLWVQAGGEAGKLSADIRKGSSRPSKKLGLLGIIKKKLAAKGLKGLGATDAQVAQFVTPAATAAGTVISGPTGAAAGASLGEVLKALMPILQQLLAATAAADMTDNLTPPGPLPPITDPEPGSGVTAPGTPAAPGTSAAPAGGGIAPAGGSNKMILYIAAAAAAVLLLPKLLK